MSNLTAIVDANRFKAMDDASTCCKALAPVGDRWSGFGWHVRDIDGHNVAEICSALDWASSQGDRPAVIVAHTVKGKGVPYWEERHAHYEREDVAKIGLAQAREALKGR